MKTLTVLTLSKTWPQCNEVWLPEDYEIAGFVEGQHGILMSYLGSADKKPGMYDVYTLVAEANTTQNLPSNLQKAKCVAVLSAPGYLSATHVFIIGRGDYLL